MIVFFDVDGVLIEGWHADPTLRKPWDATLEADLGVNPEAFQDLMFAVPAGRSVSRMAECISGRRDLADALSEVLPPLGYSGSPDQFMRYWFEKDSSVNPAVLSLVRQIGQRCQARMFIATGQEHCRARYLWDNLGFSKHFDRMFYSAELGYLKKDPRFFEAINRAMGIDPGADPAQGPLFFDDQPEIVALPRNAGWDATVFTSIRDIREHPRLRCLKVT